MFELLSNYENFGEHPVVSSIPRRKDLPGEISSHVNKRDFCVDVV